MIWRPSGDDRNRSGTLRPPTGDSLPEDCLLVAKQSPEKHSNRKRPQHRFFLVILHPDTGHVRDHRSRGRPGPFVSSLCLPIRTRSRLRHGGWDCIARVRLRIRFVHNILCVQALYRQILGAPRGEPHIHAGGLPVAFRRRNGRTAPARGRTKRSTPITRPVRVVSGAASRI